MNTPVSGKQVILAAVAGAALLALMWMGARSANVTRAAHGGAAVPTADERAVLLRDAIASTGYSCDVATRTFHRGGSPSTGDFWDVACRNGKSYAVQRKPSGEAQILSCEMLKLTTKLDCFVPFSQ